MTDDKKPVRPIIDLARRPRKGPIKVWSGRGSGAVCSHCGQRIESPDLEYEVELDDGTTRYLMHVECFAHWQTERVSGP